MDSPNVRIAKRFVDWWQKTHGNISLNSPEYALAQDAFITGFMSPLMNGGEQLSPDIAKSLRKQIEEAVKSHTPKSKP